MLWANELLHSFQLLPRQHLECHLVRDQGSLGTVLACRSSFLVTLPYASASAGPKSHISSSWLLTISSYSSSTAAGPSLMTRQQTRKHTAEQQRQE